MGILNYEKDFYIYQEDLINYEITTNEITITDLVMDLNCKFCMDGMKNYEQRQ